MGLLQLVDDEVVDMFQLVKRVRMEFGVVLEGLLFAEDLGFVEIKGWDVVRTAEGGRFLAQDVAHQRETLHEKFAALPIFIALKEWLHAMPSGEMDAETLQLRIAKFAPAENSKELAVWLGRWGVFAMLIDVDTDRKVIRISSVDTPRADGWDI